MTRVVASLACLAAAGAALDTGCSGTNTQEPALIVVATTDLTYPRDYDLVDIKVTQEGPNGIFGQALFDMGKAVALPTTFTVRPGSTSDQTARIVVRLIKGITNTVVSSTAQVVVPSSGVEELPMFLGSSCENVTCPAADTCSGGQCVSFVLPPSALKPYNPDDVANPDATAPPADGGGNDVTTPPSDGGVDTGHPADAREEDGGAACGASNCTGCCDTSTGKCVTGNTTSLCGTGGAACSACGNGETCSSAGKCVGACGTAGAACCPYDQCQQGGCCDHGTCVAPNGQCAKSGGMCNNGACLGGCGIPGATCCAGTSGLACTAAFTECVGTTCSPCGGGMQACCPGDVCQAGLACAPPPPGADAAAGKTCVGCGNSGQFCCNPDSGVTGAPTSACGPGLTCGGLNQCH